jgi:LacI family transcriptional regulator
MKRTKAAPSRPRTDRSPTLRELASKLGLSPATVSLVLNGETSIGIAADTQELVRAKAREMGYRPNFLARSLRTRRSYSVGVMIPGVREGYNVLILQGIEDYLAQKGYFYYVASHYLKPELVEEYARGFTDRAADGLILVSAPWQLHLSIPVATISSYHQVKGSTSVLLDHGLAAELALRHLMELGHRRVAFIKGTPNVPDSEVRWRAITDAAEKLGLAIRPKLVEPIVVPTRTPQIGYDVTKKLLRSGERFTALFAFNDVSAIGAIHALQDEGLKVPADVSVIGFDDIESAGYMGPGLTTVRQPLEEMGRAAAESVLQRIGKPAEEWAGALERIIVEPELVVRETTAPAREKAR